MFGHFEGPGSFFFVRLWTQVPNANQSRIPKASLHLPNAASNRLPIPSQPRFRLRAPRETVISSSPGRARPPHAGMHGHLAKPAFPVSRLDWTKSRRLSARRAFLWGAAKRPPILPKAKFLIFWNHFFRDVFGQKIDLRHFQSD